MRTETDWVRIVEGYDSRKETIKAYCGRLHIATSAYYTHRKKIHADQESRLVPVVVERPEFRSIEVNRIPLRYDGSLSDEELKRLIRLCGEI